MSGDYPGRPPRPETPPPGEPRPGMESPPTPPPAIYSGPPWQPTQAGFHPGAPQPPAPPPRGRRGLVVGLAAVVAVGVIATVAVIVIGDDSDPDPAPPLAAPTSGASSSATASVPGGIAPTSAAPEAQRTGPWTPVVDDPSTWPDACMLLKAAEVKAAVPGATEVIATGEVVPADKDDPRPVVHNNTCHFAVKTGQASDPVKDPIKLDLNLLDVNTESVLAADYAERKSRSSKYDSIFKDLRRTFGADDAFLVSGDVVFRKGPYLFGIAIDGDLVGTDGEDLGTFDWGPEVTPPLAMFVLERL